MSNKTKKLTDGWISVEDRLPEIGKNVLVYDCFSELEQIPELSMSTAHYDGMVWRDYLSNRHIYSEEITHWQPLPSPPKPKPTN